jgi:transposase InsO family protein
MSDVEARVSIPVFSGSVGDFEAWKVRFEAMMEIKGVGALLSAGWDPANGDDAAKAENAKLNARLFSYLVLALDERSCALILEKCNKAGHAAWRLLTAKYERSDALGILNMRRALAEVQLVDCANMDEYLNKIHAWVRKINAAAGKRVIEDLEIITCIFNGLPRDPYGQWMVAKNASTNALTLESVEAELTKVADYLTSVDGSARGAAQNSVVFHAARGGAGRGVGRGGGTAGGGAIRKCFTCGGAGHFMRECPNVVCYSCGQVGHYKRDCPSVGAAVRGGTGVGRGVGRGALLRGAAGGRGQGAAHGYYAEAEPGTVAAVSAPAVVVDDVNVLGFYAGTHPSTEPIISGVAFFMEAVTDDTWVVDSGATVHVCKDKAKFVKLEPNVGDICVYTADKVKCIAAGIGDVEIVVPHSSSDGKRLVLHDVLYVPTFSRNLMSMTRAADAGHVIELSKDGGSISWLGNKTDYIKISRVQKLYVITEVTATGEANIGVGGVPAEKLSTWHARLGHVGGDMIKRLVQSVEGLNLSKLEAEMQNCDVCNSTKLTRAPFGTTPEDHRATKPLQRVHSDIQGPQRTAALGGGEVYVMNFIDEYSRLHAVYLLKRKSDALDKFKQFRADIEAATGHKVGILHSDNGGEYISDRFKAYCRDNGIHEAGENVEYSAYGVSIAAAT